MVRPFGDHPPEIGGEVELWTAYNPCASRFKFRLGTKLDMRAAASTMASSR
jgi:hypothetical protein